MSETLNQVQIIKDPEIPSTVTYSIDVTTSVTFYKNLEAPLRSNDERREQGGHVESRLDHLRAHMRDLRSRLKVETVEEAIPRLRDIAMDKTSRVRHFNVSSDESRVAVWDSRTEVVVITQTGKRKRDDALPPPAYIVTAYRISPKELDEKLRSSNGPKWIPEKSREPAYA